MNTTQAERLRRVCQPFRFGKMPPVLWWVAAISMLVLTIVVVGPAIAWLETQVLQDYADWTSRIGAP